MSDNLTASFVNSENLPLTQNNSMIKTITVAYGDGIGPEIMESTLRVLLASGALLKINAIEVGKKIYEQGFNSGLLPSAWESLNDSKVILKAPITTPQGGGYKSLNVTMRKKLGLYANVRPVSSFYPFVATNFPKMDLVIIRENEEDLYAGIEYRQSQQTFECLKLITKKGCEKIIRYAFEYAVANGRKKVSCFSKDNIMKMTDGIFHKIFDEIAKQYPEIATDHYIIDIACARLAARPEIFDVIVTLNLYGDIISDIAAEISGSVGLAGSANIGENYAMFEAIHGSAPDIAGQNIANPTGLINAAVMMLVHLGQSDIANKIRNALYKTLEDGVHTADIFNEKTSQKKVGTAEFADAVIANLGAIPSQLPMANFVNKNAESSEKSLAKNANQANAGEVSKQSLASKIENKSLIGFDLYIEWSKSFEELLVELKNMESAVFELKMISAKGLLLFPLIDAHMMPNYDGGLTALRFIGKGITGKSSGEIIDASKTISQTAIFELCDNLTKIAADDQTQLFDIVKFEGLYLFDGKPGYTSGQGE